MAATRAFGNCRNYNYWNVLHTLQNSEILHNECLFAIRSCRDKEEATRYLLGYLPDATPDGVAYTFRNVRAALNNIS